MKVKVKSYVVNFGKTCFDYDKIRFYNYEEAERFYFDCLEMLYPFVSIHRDDVDVEELAPARH